jgi:leader peptidase (prepilin peptidase)/N-methyltransferase
VKLAATIGLAVGTLGASAVWLALLTGSLAAVVWAKATRRVGPIPYAPWFQSGAWIGALVMAAVNA